MDKRRIARGLLLRGGILLASLAVFAVVINFSWFDEPLNPEIERLIEPQPVSMEDNAYPLIYGFPAADSIDARAAGLAVIDRLRERYREGRPIGLSEEEMEAILGGTGFDESWQADFESLSCNSRLALDCAGPLIAEVDSGSTLPPRLRILLQRYEQILSAGHFAENQEFDSSTPIPPYGLVMAVGRIRLARLFNGESTAEFLASATQDIAFWRTVLRDGQSLIAKMVALAGIRNDLEFISAAMRERDLDEGETQWIERNLRPLTSDERDIGESFLADFRIGLLSKKLFVYMPTEPSWLTRLLLQENATVNEFYTKIVTPTRLRALLDAEAFYRQNAYERLSYRNRANYRVRVFPPQLYNLGGKLLVNQIAGTFNVQDYISRVHDIDGRIALVLLQTEIERSPGRTAQAVVSASALRNPYTHEPMDYDAANGTIGFDCVAENSNDVCAVVIGSGTR